MAAGLGYIEFLVGDVLTAPAANGYLASQVVMVFADSAARTSAIASPQEGMLSYLKDTDSTEYYDGSAWAAIGGSSSPLTTKGDIYTYSTADARLAVGTNDYVLTADSAEATGLKWAAAAATGFSGVSVKATANQSMPNATFTAITWNSEYFDTDSFHSTATNTSRFTIPTGKAGYYSIIGRLDYAANVTQSRRMAIYKNGTLIQGQVFVVPSGGFEITTQIATVLNLDVADYIEIYGFQNSGGALDVYKTGGESEFTMTFLGA